MRVHSSCFSVVFSFLRIVSALPYHDVRSADADESVLTPVGHRPKSSAVLIPNDANLHFTDEEIQVVYKNGTVDCRFPRYAAEPKPPPAFSSGYVAYAYYITTNASDSITSFSTKWPVPPNPTTDNGQSIFLFNGLIQENFDSILQPVLQWGPSASGGGPSWQVSSWFVGPTNAFWTPPISVSAGQSLTGIMTVDASSKTYTSSFAGIPETTLTIGNGPDLTMAYEALEAYNIQAKSNYPTGKTTFTDINLVGPSAVSWTAFSTPADGITTRVVIDSGINGEINVHYT